MAEKVNQFAEVVQDIRREIRKGKENAARSNPPTMTQSMRKLDPKSDPIRQAIEASGIKMRTLRKRVL
jgi:hypothetical protein